MHFPSLLICWHAIMNVLEFAQLVVAFVFFFFCTEFLIICSFSIFPTRAQSHTQAGTEEAGGMNTRDIGA